MQYGLWKIAEGKKIMIDAAEYGFIQECIKNDINPYKIEYGGLDDDKTDYCPLSINYGRYYPNPGIHKDNEIENFLMSTRKFLYNCFDIKDGTFKELQIVDFVYAPIKSSTNKHAVIALTRMSEYLKSQITEDRGLPSFFRYCDLSAIDNIFNRPGILSLMETQKIINGQLTANNWKQYIDYSKLDRIMQKTECKHCRDKEDISLAGQVSFRHF